MKDLIYRSISATLIGCLLLFGVTYVDASAKQVGTWRCVNNICTLAILNSTDTEIYEYTVPKKVKDYIIKVHIQSLMMVDNNDSK